VNSALDNSARRSSLNGLALALFGLLAATAVAPVNAAKLDESGIRTSLDRLASGWNTPSADAWAQEYWPDGELINILGLLYASPVDIRNRTAEILAGPFRASHFAFAVRRIRFIGADAAIVDTDITISGFRGLPGIAPTRPNELTTRMKHIYERRHGKWLIVASQNTAVIPPPTSR